MLTDVHLHGALGEKFGPIHQFDIANAPQACAALAANYKDFHREFMAGEYIIKIGEDEIAEEHLRLRIGRGRAVHILPVAVGARKGGIKAIAGIALLSFATFGAASAVAGFSSAAATSAATAFSVPAFTIGGYAVSYGSLAATGLLMTLQGVSALLSPVPKADYSNRNPVDQRASFLFNGPTNRSAEGTPIPIVYGRFTVGSIVFSAGISVEQLLGT